ncbi:hypothetical protein, partial [Bradyrhizobium pachyrhizi]|uniref:hypothetical protein n=1 Tax=Bradyrhizobium pachyrhizi TaxID=280333 RepID=UPI001AEDAF4E
MTADYVVRSLVSNITRCGHREVVTRISPQKTVIARLDRAIQYPRGLSATHGYFGIKSGDDIDWVAHAGQRLENNDHSPACSLRGAGN